jgi:hypothetical protein
MNLLAQIKKLVAEERQITIELLKLLLQAEREKLYAERGYCSLYEFCVKELGYSEGAAVRRINAMRLMKSHEGVEEKLRSGTLTISVASQVHGAMKKAKIPLDQRDIIIQSVQGLSAREVEKKLLPILPAIRPPKREIRPVSERESLLNIIIDEPLLQQLNQLRALYSHRKPGMSYRDLIELLASDALKKKKHSANYVGEALRYIAPALKEKIRKRDGGCCTFVDPLTGNKCDSTHLLEFDHILPVAHGGRATEENLRLLCRTHNQLMAKKAGLLTSRSITARSSPNTS